MTAMLSFWYQALSLMRTQCRFLLKTKIKFVLHRVARLSEHVRLLNANSEKVKFYDVPILNKSSVCINCTWQG